MEIEIIHDKEKKRFYCLCDTMESFVTYESKGGQKHCIDVYKTFVPESLRGKGIAEKLLGAVSSFARENKLLVIPSCSYAVLYYKRHSQYLDVVAKEVDLNNGGSCRI